MARPYSVSFAAVALSAVQDLIAVYAGNKAFELRGFTIGQVTATTPQFNRISVKRLPVTVTPGSVGSAQTPVPLLSGDSAAVITARKNDTTQATTNGTAVTLHADTVNWVNGYSFFFPEDESLPGFDINQACILSLDSAPSPAVTASVTLFCNEYV
jgi:hypothetical protein